MNLVAYFVLLFFVASRSNRSSNNRDLSNGLFGGSIFGGGGFSSDFGFGSPFNDRYRSNVDVQGIKKFIFHAYPISSIYPKHRSAE